MKQEYKTDIHRIIYKANYKQCKIKYSEKFYLKNDTEKSDPSFSLLKENTRPATVLENDGCDFLGYNRLVI